MGTLTHNRVEVQLADIEPSVPQRPRPSPPAPLLAPAVGLMCGIVADDLLTPPPFAGFSLLLAGIVAAVVFRRRAPVRFAAFMIAAAGLGAMRHDLAFRRVADDHIVRFTDARPVITKVRGRVLSAPQIVEPSPNVPRAYEHGPKTRFTLEATHLAGRDGPLHVSGKVAVSIQSPILTLRMNDIIELTGWLYQPRGPQNPGAYDWRLAMRRAGILAGMSCDQAEALHVLSQGGTGWARFWSDLRGRFRGYLLHEGMDENDEGAGVIEAMVLGQRGAVSKAMNEAFVRTGNAHFLAASGMNVAWLAAMGWGLMRLLGVYYRTTAIVVGVMIVSYVLLAEPQPSILRAGIIGVLLCLTIWMRGRYASLNSLAAAAVIILLIDPTDVFRPAFQCSFLAVVALLHLCPRLAGAMSDWLLRKNWSFAAASVDPSGFGVQLIDRSSLGVSALSDTFLTLLHWAVQFFLLSLSAWFVTAPLSCYIFNNFTPFGSVQTLLLWFFVAPVTTLGYAALFLGLVFPSSSVFTGPLLKFGTNLMTDFVEVLARIPCTLIDGRSPSLAWVLTTYATLAIWIYRRSWIRRPHAFKVLTLLLLVWWALPPRWFIHDRHALQVWMLSVGDGTGTVIELPNGRVMLFDLGTRSPFDVGTQAVSFLRHRGIRRIDCAIVSHTDVDHFSAIERIAKELEVGRVVINDQFEIGVREKSAAWYFLRTLKDQGIPLEVTSGPHRFEGTGDVMVEAIWPPAASERVLQTDNDRSTVVRLTYQGRSILLTGDITDAAMAALLSSGDLKADVLALPHHGSVVPTTKRFIDSVDPSVTVRSSGERGEATINGIDKLTAGRTYFSTSDDGCVMVEIQNRVISASAVMREKQ